MKTPLVLLPGMMCDDRLFAPQIEAFSDSYKVIVISLDKQSSITLMAEKVLDETPAQFHLLGLSMGGIVAMEIMRLAANRVERLALLDTNPFPDTIDTKKIRNQHIQAVRQGKLKEVMLRDLKPRYLAEGPHKNSILDICMDMALTLGDDVFIAQNTALRERISQEQTLPLIKVPTLVLCGNEDRLCPLERHVFMSTQIPHATLQVVKGAGHLPTLEQPETTNTHISAWLQAD